MNSSTVLIDLFQIFCDAGLGKKDSRPQEEPSKKMKSINDSRQPMGSKTKGSFVLSRIRKCRRKNEVELREQIELDQSENRVHAKRLFGFAAITIN